MQFRIFLFLAVVLTGLFCITACKKSTVESGKSNTVNLTASTWKFSDAGIDLDSNGTIETALPPGSIQACDKDNTLTFKSDFTGIADEGATKCTATNPQTAPFTWSFVNNESYLNVSNTIFGVTGMARISALNETRLALSKKVDYNGTMIPITVIMVH